jgi:hypothetical protein
MLHRAELSRALRNHHFERTDDGRLLFPRAGLVAAGAFRTWVNGADEQIDSNILVLTGLDDILKVYFAQSAQRTAFYIAPFSGNVAPVNTLDAATFPATQTEFINYTEATRPVWAKDAEATQNIANATTPARFTADTGGGTVWGAAMTTASAKSAITGLLVCCAQFAASRVLQATDKLDIEYAITAADGT